MLSEVSASTGSQTNSDIRGKSPVVCGIGYTSPNGKLNPSRKGEVCREKDGDHS